MLRQILVFVCLFALARPFGFGQSGDAKPEIPAGTEMQLSLRDPLSSKLSETGDEVVATVRRDVVIDGRTVIKQGTEIIGRVTLAESAKRPFKGGRLHITFERIRLDGQEQKIVDFGIEIKDLDKGLCDFPHLRDGRVVFLCWLKGEDRIEWWHDVDAGFAGRQPL